jgi:hypothetical protein
MEVALATQNIPTIDSGRKPSFTLTRKGGSVIHGRLDIWSGVGSPDEQREKVLFFEDSLDPSETFTRELTPGVYGCILKVFVVEDLNGTFDWTHLVDSQPVFTAKGNVDATSATGESQRFRSEFVLRVS